MIWACYRCSDRIDNFFDAESAGGSWIEMPHSDAEIIRDAKREAMDCALSVLTMHAGTIVDAIIIAASSSAKNAGNTRDPEMH